MQKMKYESFDTEMTRLEQAYCGKVISSETERVAYMSIGGNLTVVMARNTDNAVVLTRGEALALVAELPGILEAAPYFR